ncbi:transmembrane protein 104 isoform X3 [Hydra vulgaris]|uniref:Transmembrane protein 104 isoform X3 n=1 Tax=Hydra vulgaris TaxID=6087 RepID=A0ABM4CE25_HYDVU
MSNLKSPEDVQYYSWQIAFVYVFNLIVGAGALTLPKAFAQTGWVLGLAALGVLALMSYCTTTFMIEAMSIANAIIRIKNKSGPTESSHLCSRFIYGKMAVNSVAQSVNNDAFPEVEQTLNIQTDEDNEDLISTHSNNEVYLYEITEKVEMGQLARFFFNKVGLVLYYIVIALYLYGDLAIYAAAVPKSLTTVICGGTVSFKKDNLKNPCQNAKSLSVEDMYRIMLVVFVALLCPFAFFNLSKTKLLQIFTTLFRWIAFTLMIILAIVKISNGEGTHRVKLIDFTNLPNFFGVAVYAFMCQHSLPSIVTPVRNKSRINFIILMDFFLVSLFYVLLVLTAVFSVAESKLEDLYTLNFESPAFCKYFLELFPVFTLSTSFPIIAITLRENLKTLFMKEDRQYGLFMRRYLFPLVTVTPPVIIAFVTSDVNFLVSVTGSYAGAIIQYVIPVMLVYSGRNQIKKCLGSYVNKYRSPFRQRSWIFFVIAWYAACLIFVTIDHIRHH